MKLLIRSVCFAFVLTLSACGGSAPSAPSATPANGGEATQTMGDVIIRANALQTSTLNEAVARQYGIARDDKTILLLVAARKLSAGSETSLRGKVTASATGLAGNKQAIIMRELRTGDLVDYVGIVETSLPETLRFEVTLVSGHGDYKLQFNREFYPR